MDESGFIVLSVFVDYQDKQQKTYISSEKLSWPYYMQV